MDSMELPVVHTDTLLLSTTRCRNHAWRAPCLQQSAAATMASTIMCDSADQEPERLTNVETQTDWEML